MTSYADALDYLYHLQSHGIHPGLRRIESLLSRLDHPETKFKSIHIGGTNGKGSTAATVASILQQSGFRVGLYTSPHLIDFSERIQISGIPITEREIVSLTHLIRDTITTTSSNEAITFFEFTTALAFYHFACSKIDFAVVEVGMGGRYDATNLLQPMAVAITPVSLDHEQYLGSTLAKIAYEKAGIIKEGTPVVISRQAPSAYAVIQEVARLKNAPLIQLGQEICTVGDSPQNFLYQGKRERNVQSPLLGRHQMDNAAVALGLIEEIQRQGTVISEDAIAMGFRNVRWPGRLEVVRQRPFILLDGAHNPAGAEALGAFLSEVDPEKRGKHWLIFGVMQDKDSAQMLQCLLPWTDECVLCCPDLSRAAKPEAILRGVQNKACIHTVCSGVSDAIRYVESVASPRDSLVITGSLYTVGEAKGFFTGETPSPLRGERRP